MLLSNEENEASIQWMRQRLNMAIVQIDQSFEQYRLSEALLTVYNLVWDEFCSWYLEMIKPRLRGGQGSRDEGQEPSAASAERVASTMRSASTRASRTVTRSGSSD